MNYPTVPYTFLKKCFPVAQGAYIYANGPAEVLETTELVIVPQPSELSGFCSVRRAIGPPNLFEIHSLPRKGLSCWSNILENIFLNPNDLGKCSLDI